MIGYFPDDTIAALATPSGVGAIGVIRISGPKTFEVLDQVFQGKKLSEVPTHTVHLGKIKDGDQELDEVLVAVFHNPKSYTGQDVAEISCHGSSFIQERILELLGKQGIRLASPGEFTLRAFLNGKMDLSQAEAVADMIAADSAGALKTAMYQMKGGFSKEISVLRQELIDFASLVELELDFSEEDVEFADRDQLANLILKILAAVNRLIESFRFGNVMKNGYATVIAGKPNAGKSTLLNALLNEERAIVSDIAGTTRDTVEEAIQLKGILFRFIDTAGIRHDAESEIEKIGIARALEKMKNAAVVIYLFDAREMSLEEVAAETQRFETGQAEILLVANKVDGLSEAQQKALKARPEILQVSAKNKDIDSLIAALSKLANEANLGASGATVSNVRHLEALRETKDALEAAYTGLNSGLTGDLLAEDIRRAIHYLGDITGEISTDDLLGNIFGKFCIGK
ncbi:MAG: tRNA uridine-5-carboxymethylaminomethyl(34) synthesis GTPase MnmE [Bacteroidetes bacterium]|nr:MAG: tRNA uridine-5-carboxymethylaminomethyl(34) synthesis GTPase MnmE [Bacteroidota bacterium]